MERLDRVATHDGIVTKVLEGRVEVRIEAVSACASCAAHGRCGFAESKEKRVEVPTKEWQQYSVGQNVKVNIDESRGMQAVWIAYVLPSLLLLAVIIGLSIARLPEWMVVVSAFLMLTLYIVVLYLRRKKVEGKFTLTVAPC